MVMSSPLAGAEMMTFLGASGDVLASARRIGEEAGRLNDDVGADLGPRQAAGVALREHGKTLLALDRDLTIAGDDVLAEPTKDAVVLEQVRERLRVRQVVDGNDLDISSGSLHGTVEVAADAAKAIDTNANSSWACLS